VSAPTPSTMAFARVQKMAPLKSAQSGAGHWRYFACGLMAAAILLSLFLAVPLIVPGEYIDSIYGSPPRASGSVVRTAQVVAPPPSFQAPSVASDPPPPPPLARKLASPPPTPKTSPPPSEALPAQTLRPAGDEPPWLMQTWHDERMAQRRRRKARKQQQQLVLGMVLDDPASLMHEMMGDVGNVMGGFMGDMGGAMASSGFDMISQLEQQLRRDQLNGLSSSNGASLSFSRRNPLGGVGDSNYVVTVVS